MRNWLKINPVNSEKGTTPFWYVRDAILIALGCLLVYVSVVSYISIVMARPPGYANDMGVLEIYVRLFTGRIRWSTLCTIFAACQVIVTIGIWLGIRAIIRRLRRGDHPLDAAAKFLADTGQWEQFGPDGSERSARRLRPSLAKSRSLNKDDTGLLVGRTVVGNMPIRQSWQDVTVEIWGPRTGKTSTRAIPAIVAAPGPVVVSSIKRDVIDATRDVREQRGKVWIFDPQRLIFSDLPWWWNPLTQIRNITDARRLASHFAVANRQDGSLDWDAFFETTAEELIANFMLAAAMSGRYLTDVYRWACSPNDRESVEILQEKHQDMPAATIAGVLDMTDHKRQAGVFASAQKMLGCLTESLYTRWVSPSSNSLQRLDPSRFIRSTDTLYLLGTGGTNSPAPLLAACADAIMQEGERATDGPGHRLDPPLLTVLDESANVCKLPALPNRYPRYGARGMPVITLLRSYAQGKAAWGEEGMRMLWGSANIRTYGGGETDYNFLNEMSHIVGFRDVPIRGNTRTDTFTETINYSLRPEPILDVATLGAIPQKRMVVFSSGARATIAKTNHWSDGPYAGSIRNSLAKWNQYENDVVLEPAEPAESEL